MARPDLAWWRAAEVGRLTALLPSNDIVILGNDWRALWPRAQWHVLSAMRSLACDRACSRDYGLVLHPAGHTLVNEYCLLLSHLARHSVRAIEASHPKGREILHFGSNADWLAPLRESSLVRWAAPPPQRAPELGLHCKWDKLWRCDDCIRVGHATGQEGLSLCPEEDAVADVVMRVGGGDGGAKVANGSICREHFHAWVRSPGGVATPGPGPRCRAWDASP